MISGSLVREGAWVRSSPSARGAAKRFDAGAEDGVELCNEQP